jgi:TRAP-type mannitol/chloroaromatic compound transport system permease small subunit
MNKLSSNFWFWSLISLLMLLAMAYVYDQNQTTKMELLFASLTMASWFMCAKDYCRSK